FKIFADIDVFDIELNLYDVDSFVNAVKAMEPTFGGINLEDIKAPECFEIERRLKEELNIPVMHDDQHGTAIISSAALLNALFIAGKKIEDVRVVFNGAGASAQTCAKLYLSLGLKKENLVVLDSKGVINESREGLDKQKQFFITTRKITTLEEAMKDADVFVGLSRGNIVSQDMVKSMADNPVVFALANPDPEISYKDAKTARPDIIMATGRSDHPNQVNNVLGFPFIFRGALDVKATTINEEMKLAAVRAIAELAKEPIPQEVNEAYDTENLAFGPDNIIPKPLDPRLITTVAPAVAKAAMESGVAQQDITDWNQYVNNLRKRLGHDNQLIRDLTSATAKNPQRILFAEADNYKMLKAAQVIMEEGIGIPVLLGETGVIKAIINENQLPLEGVEIIDQRAREQIERVEEYSKVLFDKRNRKGMTMYEAGRWMRERNYFGSMMLETGEVDAMVTGLTKKYPTAIRPSLQVIGSAEGNKTVAGMNIIVSKRGTFFFADTTININPSVDDLVEITVMTAEAIQQLGVKPRIAMLSYSNFGSSGGEDAIKMKKAVAIIHKEHPNIIVDGEVQANFALNDEIMNEQFPFSQLSEHGANAFIFPNLSAGNIAYKMVQELVDVEVIGPILLGMNKSVHILQLGSSIREIINMSIVAAFRALKQKKQAK
ncbi:MAG: NADP-dependent malic enzyme, partial [Flavobacteriales bacterium]|nr:NADP-dependent malic enzyme [Flavobacteriales bacterium]